MVNLLLRFPPAARAAHRLLALSALCPSPFLNIFQSKVEKRTLSRYLTVLTTNQQAQKSASCVLPRTQLAFLCCAGFSLRPLSYGGRAVCRFLQWRKIMTWRWVAVLLDKFGRSGGSLSGLTTNPDEEALCPSPRKGAIQNPDALFAMTYR